MKYFLAFALVLSQFPALLSAGSRLKAGDPIPTIVLPDHQNRPVSVNSLIAKGPVILIFYRGNWCPFCELLFRIQAEQCLEKSLSTIYNNSIFRSSFGFYLALEILPVYTISAAISKWHHI